MLPVGHTLQSRYVIAAYLGGGMASVYRAQDRRLSIDVAVKEFVPPPGLSGPEMAQLQTQFRQEATVLARLNHPGIVSVTDFFEEDGRAFLVMQLVPGENLAQLVARQGPLPEAAVVRLGEQLLAALAYCHGHDVLHRDIKPNNIIVLPDGAPVLVDFGLLKMWNPANPTTHTLLRGMGTPHYASPEHYGFAIGHTDARSDIYSVGATLYFALTGQEPPAATDRLMQPELMAPPERVAPWLSVNVAAVVAQALSIQREARFASAAAMRAALLSARSAAVPAGPPTTARISTTMPAGQRVVALWPAALAALAVVIIGFVAWNALRGGGNGSPTPAAKSAVVVPVVATPTASPPPAVAATAATAPTTPTTAPARATNAPPPTKTIAPTAAPTVIPTPKATAVPTAAPVVPAGGAVTAARIAAPSIDGDLSEWAGRTAYDSPFLVYWDDGWDETHDGTVLWHLGWDDANLYIAAQVTDNIHVQTQTGNQIYRGDGLEVQIDTDGGGATSVGPREFQVNLSPGDFASLPPSANLSQGTEAGGMFDAPNGHHIAVAARRTADGYTLEAAVPWADLFLAPGSGAMAIALNLDDNDRIGQAVQETMYSNAPNRRLFDPSTWLPFSLAQ